MGKDRFQGDVSGKNGDMFDLSKIMVASAIYNGEGMFDGKNVVSSHSCTQGLTPDNSEHVGRLVSRFENSPLIRGFVVSKDGSTVRDILTGESLQALKFSLASPAIVGEKDSYHVYFDGTRMYAPVGNPSYENISNKGATLSVPGLKTIGAFLSMESGLDIAQYYGMAGLKSESQVSEKVCRIDNFGLPVSLPTSMMVKEKCDLQTLKTFITELDKGARLGYEDLNKNIDKMFNIKKSRNKFLRNLGDAEYTEDDNTKETN